ncbi:hypothetical protein [Embleya sp. NPDC050493]|uniref:hypothetical protein n=1 Tax=Embleya sp. NPDC050493 TaxID=3363989 RepID=UPI003793A400
MTRYESGHTQRMEIIEARGYLTLPGAGDVEIDLDPYDWPPAEHVGPVARGAVIADGPELDVGTEGELHVDGENTEIGHPFTAIMNAGRADRIRSRENRRRTFRVPFMHVRCTRAGWAFLRSDYPIGYRLRPTTSEKQVGRRHRPRTYR